MAKEAGVVKSVNGGIARALNDLTGEVRQLSVGDIVYQGEKIVTEGSNSKVTITQTDGKDITLIGKDTLTLDQDSNNNETVADISALQQAILKGTDLNALEETAAGGPQAGGNGGDGVSLSSTSFAEGGHISNINANVGSIDALALAAGGDNSFGVSGGSAVGAGAGATTPKVGINISSAGSNEGGVMTYDLSLPTALTARPTTLNLNFSGGVAGVDYDANSIEYSTDGGSTWTRGTIVNLTDANQINSVKVRVKTIDNYGLDGVDLAHNPTAMGANQNQGEQDGSKYSNLNGVEYGVYKRNLTLNVTTDNDEIANSQANGKITDNDDYVSINQGLNGANIATEDGEDTLNMNTGAYANSNINLGAGDDALNIKGGTFSNVGIDLGKGNNTVTIENSFGDVDDSSYNKTYITNWQSGNDTVTIKSGATVKNAEIGVHNGEDVITLEKGATLEHSRVIMGDGDDTLNINGTVTRESHINLDYGEDTLNVGEGAKISDSDIQTDDSGNGYKDTVNIANKVTLENWADIQAGGGDDIINAGDDLTISNKSGIHGDWGNNANTVSNDGDGNDTITIGKNLQMSGGSTISGGGGNDEITIGDNANISDSTIQGGAGNDKISLTNGTKITNSSVLLGDGENTLNITRDSSKDGSDITLDSAIIQGGSDNDTVNISDTTKESGEPKVKLQGNTAINLGDGDNKINIDGKVKLGNMEEPTKNVITTGKGEDFVTLTNGASIEGRVIKTGEGRDVVELYDGSSLNSAKIETGEGEDMVYLAHHSIDNASDPDQPYLTPVATNTKINMGDGRDTLIANGLGNKGNFENRVSDLKNVDIDMGDGDIKHVQINSGKVDTINITTGSKNDMLQIQGDSLLEGKNNINTGAGEDNLTIDNSKIKGTATEKTKINTGADRDDVAILDSTLDHTEIDTGSGPDEVTIRNSTLKNTKILTGDGADRVYIEDEVTLDGTINTGADDDEVNIKGNITATTQSNIITGAGSDTINIDSGVTLTHTVIEMGAGEDTIEISGMDRSESSTDRITFKGSTLYTDDAGYTANDIDHVTITNTTFMKSDDGRLSSVQTGGGDDEITVKDGTVFQDASFIQAGDGEDKIYLNSGSTFNYSKVFGGNGGDEIHVNGAEFNGKYGHGGVDGEAGDDKIFVNSGTFNNANIEGGAGNDTIEIKQDTILNNANIRGDAGDDTIVIGKGTNISGATIDGGAGNDTLKVADSSIDFSKIKNIETLDITDINKTSADTNVVTLSANDVLDMTDSHNKLKIDGDGNDKLNLSGGGWSKGASNDGYTAFTSGTVTVEVKDDMVNNVIY